jgi:hypothetical protein
MLTGVLALSACSSGDGDDAGAGGGTADSAASRPDASDQRASKRDGNALDDGLSADLAEGAAPEPASLEAPEETQGELEKAIISQGNVQLQSEDVEKAVFDVQALTDSYAGEITERETVTNDDGDVRMARLVLRIPSKDFQDAFVELQDVADLKSSNSTAEDVTTRVIDNAVRIRAQRRSLQRVEVLLDRAQSIRDIVAIEAQLTRRQANLDSLEKQQAYLQDQTTLSTIVVNIQLTSDEPKKEKKDDGASFLSGLEGGWDALVTFGNGVATVAGVLIPWTIVLLVLGGPLWLLFGRRLRRRSPAAPEPSDA